MTKWEVCYFSLLYIIQEVWFLFIYFLSNSRGERVTNILEEKNVSQLVFVKWKMWSQIKVPNEANENT